MIRIARICENRSAARCEATPIMSRLLISVRVIVTEVDSTWSGGGACPAAANAAATALRMGVPLGHRIHR
ncbi:hypothetical protein G6F51_014804 [Rhizopus arrhizus]|uniref:Uncharacterized protein n=1 Tax=Rhizopus oryzae TaxID=64495 RepID=A0A9P6XKU1_RHIOR|nr:hypothetical protein G6F51_014804 [Rhizopus arrhizus]